MIKLRILLFLSIFSFLFSQKIEDKEIIKALVEESKRNLRDLKIENLERPYYIEYQLNFLKSYDLSATLGSLIEESDNENAVLNTTVRVGDYKLDNTNFFDISLGFFGSSDDEERFKRRIIPFQIDYLGLKRELWLATDAAFKQSAELYSKKIATLKNRENIDTTADWTKAPFVNKAIISSKVFDIKINKEYYKTLIKEVSAIFRDYPEITSSKVIFEFIPKKIFFVNTEGMTFIKDESYFGIEISAFTQTEQGEPIYDFKAIISHDEKSLPNLDSIKKIGKALAENIKQRAVAKKLDESYNGPVLLSAEAAAELFGQFFAPYLIAQRSQMTESGVQENDRLSAFQNKIGGRVLPEFISIIDNPKINSIELDGINYSLIGKLQNDIDDEGVATNELEIVKNGYLKTLLSSRVPNKKIKQSNGRLRRGSTLYSNLIIDASKEKSLSDSELKSKLIELAKQRDLPYGIMVKKIANINGLLTGISPISNGLVSFPKSGTYIPLSLIKVYTDGREEIVKSGLGSGVNTSLFKDVIFSGTTKFVHNFLAPSVSSGFGLSGDQFVSASIVAPSILIEEAEIKVIDSDFKKSLILKNPIK
jgi:hypothetical protein